jgi:hypothetical protein
VDVPPHEAETQEDEDERDQARRARQHLDGGAGGNGWSGVAPHRIWQDSGRCLQQRGHSRKVERASVPSSASYITLGPGPRHSTRTAPSPFRATPARGRSLPRQLLAGMHIAVCAGRCILNTLLTFYGHALGHVICSTLSSHLFLSIPFEAYARSSAKYSVDRNHVTKRLWSHHEIFESLCSRDNLDCTTLQ